MRPADRRAGASEAAGESRGSGRCLRSSSRGAGAGLLGAAVVAGCAGAPSVLRPAGEAAGQLAVLGWWLLGAGSLVVVVIVTLELLTLRRRRPALAAADVSAGGGGTGRIVAGAAITAAVLSAFFIYTILVLRSTATPPSPPSLAVQVIGHQWWWDVRYRHAGRSAEAVTANEIHIPVGEPVRLEVTSEDVIHSAWVPQLHGKIDLIPGQTNVFWLEADRPGTYLGQCAEYCGMQHARMRLRVTAESPAAFEAWLARQRQPAAKSVGELATAGRQAFMDAACAFCHAVRGTFAAGRVGPDLTHVASRSTLAAGTLANTTGNLTAWIANAPGLKPGTPMPRLDLDAATLRSIVAYLQTLK